MQLERLLSKKEFFLFKHAFLKVVIQKLSDKKIFHALLFYIPLIFIRLNIAVYC